MYRLLRNLLLGVLIIFLVTTITAWDCSSAGSAPAHASTSGSKEERVSKLFPTAAVVMAGGEIELVAESCLKTASPVASASPSEDQAVSRLDRCKEIDASNADDTMWSITGNSPDYEDLGTLEPASNTNSGTLRAIYRAPAKVPATNPVTVSVEYQTAGDEAKKLVLVSHMTVIDPPKCQEYRNVTEITGHMHFAYNFMGTNSRGDSMKLSQSATVAGVLRQSDGSNSERLMWRGPIQHSALLSDGRTMGGAQISLKGTSVPHKSSEMVLQMRLSDCTYQAGLLVSVETGETIRIGFVAIPEQNAVGQVGSVRIGVRPIKDGLSGSALMPVGEQADLKETDDRYYPGGLGKDFLAQGFATVDSTGKAEASWSFGPVK